MKNPEHIKAFGNHLRKIRKQKGWSQQHLADVVNVPKITIQRIELAKSSATLDMLVSIAIGLEIQLLELLDYQ
jgi:transcriptional regulator with XRE-family HTH domain